MPLFMHSFEFANMPEQVRKMDRLYVAYGWDLTLGHLPESDVTQAIVKKWVEAAVPNGAPVCIDLEPSSAQPWAYNTDARMRPINSVVREVDRVRGVMQGLSDHVGWKGFYNMPFYRDAYMHLADRRRERRAHMAAVKSLGLHELSTHVSFDVYRFGEATDGDCDRSLEINIDEARAAYPDKPIWAWVSAWRNVTKGNIWVPPDLLKKDIERLATKLKPAIGDRIVWWGPRTYESSPGVWAQQPWNPKWAWVPVFESTLGR